MYKYISTAQTAYSKCINNSSLIKPYANTYY